MTVLSAIRTRAFGVESELWLGLEYSAHSVVTVLRAEDTRAQADAMAHIALVEERWMPQYQRVAPLAHSLLPNGPYQPRGAERPAGCMRKLDGVADTPI